MFGVKSLREQVKPTSEQKERVFTFRKQLPLFEAWDYLAQRSMKPPSLERAPAAGFWTANYGFNPLNHREGENIVEPETKVTLLWKDLAPRWNELRRANLGIINVKDIRNGIIIPASIETQHEFQNKGTELLFDPSDPRLITMLEPLVRLIIASVHNGRRLVGAFYGLYGRDNAFGVAGVIDFESIAQKSGLSLAEVTSAPDAPQLRERANRLREEAMGLPSGYRSPYNARIIALNEGATILERLAKTLETEAT